MIHTPECLSAIGLPCTCEGIPVSAPEPVVPFEQQKNELLVLAVLPVCLPSCVPEFGIHTKGCRLSPETPKIIKCTICQNDIQRFSIQTDHGDICLDCGNCAVCGDQVTIPDIDLCLRHKKLVMHSRCRMKTGNKIAIPIDEYELETLNNCRLIIVPDVEVSIETNIFRARLAHGMIWESMTLEEKYISTQVMESIYGAMYMACKQDKTEVKTKLRERDIQRTTEAHAQAKKDRQTQLPSEKRKIGLQEKFTAGMLASGVTKEQAIAIWKSQGRVWVE